LRRVFPAITSPERLATIGCCQEKRRIEAATCSTAGSLILGLAGERKTFSIGTNSTAREADDTPTPFAPEAGGSPGRAWSWWHWGQRPWIWVPRKFGEARERAERRARRSYVQVAWKPECMI